MDTEYDPKKDFSGYRDIWTYRFPTTDEVSGKRYMQYKTIKADGTVITDWTNIASSSYQTFRMPGADAETTLSSSNPGTSEPLEYTFYKYSVSDTVKKTASNGDKILDMITKGTGTSNVNQWLASPYVSADDLYHATWGLRSVDNGHVYSRCLCYSYSDSHCDGRSGVRAVVFLKSDVQLSGNSTDGWTIN